MTYLIAGWATAKDCEDIPIKGILALINLYYSELQM